MKNVKVLDAVETLSQVSLVTDKTHKDQIPQPERIKKSFDILSKYLNSLYSSKQMLLKDKDYLSSLKAVMVIAEEAYGKLDLVSKIFGESKDALGEHEFSTLFDFYLKKVNYKVEHIVGEAFRHAELEQKMADTDLRGIRNLEVIRKDKEYELFFIKDEDGQNHFSKNLMRHAQLLGTFDELFLSFSGEDPFIKMKFVDDRLKQKRCLQIRTSIQPKVDYFIKESYRYKKHPFIALSVQALMALFLSANPAFVLQNDPLKACFEFTNDLFLFLDALVDKPDFYKTEVRNNLLQDKGIIGAQGFVKAILSDLFFSKSDSSVMAEYLYVFVKKPDFQNFAPMSFFDHLLSFDQALRAYLLNFPSGPIMKALDFMKEDIKPQKFAPMRAKLPENNFDFFVKNKEISIVHLPSPTIQKDILFAEIDPFFESLLSTIKDAKSLLIDLEDPHDPYAKARLNAIFKDVSDTLEVVNIPRKGMFYEQTDVHAFIEDAEEFKAYFAQLAFEKENLYGNCGLNAKKLTKLVNFIHEVFFDKKQKLEMKDRLNFIELCNVLIGFDLMHEHDVDNVFIVCKDGIDHSNAYSLSLYAFASLINHDNLLTEKTFELFISSLMGPSLMLRDRLIFEDSLVRMCSMLTFVHSKIANDPKIVKRVHEEFSHLLDLKVKTL
jgi:hypothetical protein